MCSAERGAATNGELDRSTGGRGRIGKATGMTETIGMKAMETGLELGQMEVYNCNVCIYIVHMCMQLCTANILQVMDFARQA